MRDPDGKTPRVAAVVDLLTNPTLISALVSFLVAQSLKVCINRHVSKRWDLQILARSGGMPSSHTSLVVGLTVAVGLREGLGGSLFTACAVLTLIVAYDATNVRRFVGQQAAVLNAILAELPLEHTAHVLVRNGEQLKTSVGHTLPEVMAGALTGVVIAVFVHALS